MDLDGGDGFRLPPDLSDVAWAYPGGYRGHAKGKLVDDPDLRASRETAAPAARPSDV